MKIDLPIAQLFCERFLKCVSAEIVDVAPHLAMMATFAVARNGDACTWRINNVETGHCLSDCDRASRDACIAATRMYLAKKSVEDMSAAYDMVPPWARK